jgi:hypothetical protein
MPFWPPTPPSSRCTPALNLQAHCTCARGSQYDMRSVSASARNRLRLQEDILEQMAAAQLRLRATGRRHEMMAALHSVPRGQLHTRVRPLHTLRISASSRRLWCAQFTSLTSMNCHVSKSAIIEYAAVAASAAYMMSGSGLAPTTGVHQSDSSVSPDGGDFADSCLKPSLSPPPSCEFRTCAGGSLAADGTLKPCTLRLRHRGDHDHQTVQLSRGSLCTIHHPFIQCTGCERSVHEGCWASECIQPFSRNPWTCDVCAKKKAEEALKASEKTTVKCETGLPFAKQEAGDQHKKVTVLSKSRNSVQKMFGKEGFRVRT